jgi:hypothetical protein
MNYGLISYLAGDKQVAVAELKKAKELNPQLRQQLDNAVKNRPQYAPVLKDEQFLKQIFD